MLWVKFIRTTYHPWFEIYSHVDKRNLAGVGGWGGIRTHGSLARTAVFKTAALNRSATHPVHDLTILLSLASQVLSAVRLVYHLSANRTSSYPKALAS